MPEGSAGGHSPSAGMRVAGQKTDGPSATPAVASSLSQMERRRRLSATSNIERTSSHWASDSAPASVRRAQLNEPEEGVDR